MAFTDYVYRFLRAVLFAFTAFTSFAINAIMLLVLAFLLENAIDSEWWAGGGPVLREVARITPAARYDGPFGEFEYLRVGSAYYSHSGVLSRPTGDRVESPSTSPWTVWVEVDVVENDYTSMHDVMDLDEVQVELPGTPSGFVCGLIGGATCDAVTQRHLILYEADDFVRGVVLLNLAHYLVRLLIVAVGIYLAWRYVGPWADWRVEMRLRDLRLDDYTVRRDIQRAEGFGRVELVSLFARHSMSHSPTDANIIIGSGVVGFRNVLTDYHMVNAVRTPNANVTAPVLARHMAGIVKVDNVDRFAGLLKHHVLVPFGNNLRGHPRACANRNVCQAVVAEMLTSQDTLVLVGGGHRELTYFRKICLNVYSLSPQMTADDIAHNARGYNTCGHGIGVLGPCDDLVEFVDNHDGGRLVFIMIHVAYYVDVHSMMQFTRRFMANNHVMFMGVINVYDAGSTSNGECAQVVEDGVVVQFTGSDGDTYRHGMRAMDSYRASGAHIFPAWMGLLYPLSVIPGVRRWLRHWMRTTDYITTAATKTSRPLASVPSLVFTTTLTRGYTPASPSGVVQDTGAHDFQTVRVADNVYRLLPTLFYVECQVRAVLTPKAARPAIVRYLTSCIRDNKMEQWSADQMHYFALDIVNNADREPVRRTPLRAVRPSWVITALMLAAGVRATRDVDFHKSPLMLWDSAGAYSKPYPLCYDDDSYSEAAALRARVFLEPLPCEPGTWDVAIDALLAQHLTPTDIAAMPFEDWVARFPAGKRKMFEAFYDKWDGQPGKLKYELFVKKEVLAKEYDLDAVKPRAIQAPCYPYRILLGCWCVPFSKELARQWGAHTRILYASGQTPLQLGQFFSRAMDNVSDPAFLEFDAEKWDARVQIPALRAEQRVYRRFGGPTTLFAKQLRTRGVTAQGRLKYTFSGQRKSGDPNTSCGNTLLTVGMHLAIIKSFGFTLDDVYMMALGDDMLMIVDGGARVDPEAYKARAVAFGIILTGEIHKEPHRASFCSSYFYPCDNALGVDTRYVMAPKPGRIGIKYGWVSARVQPPDGHCAAVASSMLPHCEVIPGIASWIARDLRAGVSALDTFRPRDAHGDFESLPGLVTRNRETDTMIAAIYGMTWEALDTLSDFREEFTTTCRACE